MVAREHPHADARGARLADCRCRGRPQRVVQRDEADDLEPVLDRLVERRSRPASPAATARTRRPSPPRQRRRRGGPDRGPRGDHLRRALRERAPARAFRVDDRHALAVGVERDLLEELALGEEGGGLQAALGRRPQDRRPRSGRRSSRRRSRAPRRRGRRRRGAGARRRRAAGRSAATWISFCVSVPVLSLQMTVVSPRVSIASSRRMIAPRFASERPPSASAAVTVAARPSGTAATATATPSRNASWIGCPRRSRSAVSVTRQPDSDDHHLPGQPAEPPLERGRRRPRARRQRFDVAELGSRAGGADERERASTRHRAAGMDHRRPLGERSVGARLRPPASSREATRRSAPTRRPRAPEPRRAVRRPRRGRPRGRRGGRPARRDRRRCRARGLRARREPSA